MTGGSNSRITWQKPEMLIGTDNSSLFHLAMDDGSDQLSAIGVFATIVACKKSECSPAQTMQDMQKTFRSFLPLANYKKLLRYRRDIPNLFFEYPDVVTILTHSIDEHLPAAKEDWLSLRGHIDDFEDFLAARQR